MSILKWTGERVIPEEMINKGNNPEHQKHLDRILTEHLARYEWAKKFCVNKMVLDAACGSGYGSKMIKESGARSVLGVDVSQDAVDHANEKHAIEHLSFARVDLEQDISLPKYETIISFETIEHLVNPKNFLRYVSSSCETFIFSIPLDNATEFHKIVYCLDAAKQLIGTFFNNVQWFEQKENLIYPFKDGSSRFIIGVAKNLYDHVRSENAESIQSKNPSGNSLPQREAVCVGACC